MALLPSVIGLIDGFMQPTVDGTKGMANRSHTAIKVLLKQKEEAVKNPELYQIYVGPSGEGDRDRWYKYTNPGEAADDVGWTDAIGNDIRFAMAEASYNFRNGIKGQ